MSKFTINRSIIGANPIAPADKGGTAEEFLALIDGILADERVAEVCFDVDSGVLYNPGVVFVGQEGTDGYVNFVYPARSLRLFGRHTRADLYELKPGFGYGAWDTKPTRTRRKYDGGTFEEFVPGSRTFKTPHGWNVRGIHNAVRALDLAGSKFRKVLDANFGDCVHPVVATREGFSVGSN